MDAPWKSKWGEGERFDGGGQGDTYFVPNKSEAKGVMKLLRDARTKDPKSRRRMFQEVANLKILHNADARVPQVLDDNTDKFENTEVALFFVMERIVGDTLAKLLEEKLRLDFQTAVELTLDLCKTFTIASREGISHRDIKPENLIVTSLQPAEVVVVDLGLSFNESQSQQVTEVEEAFDNKFISLPERRGPGENKRDPRSDITGLCAVLFFCLTGCAPRNLRDSQNRPPHRWNGFSMTDIGPTPIQVVMLNALFDRGFQYELQNRFQTLEEFESRVRELATAQPQRISEDLNTIALRETQLLRETDRKTFLAELSGRTHPIGKVIEIAGSEAQAKLKGSLFTFIQGYGAPSYKPEKGDTVFRQHTHLQVQNHEVRIGIEYIIDCVGNECSVLRRTFDFVQNKNHNIESTVVMRYDGRTGEPDAHLIKEDFSRAVAVALPRLRQLIQEPKPAVNR